MGNSYVEGLPELEALASLQENDSLKDELINDLANPPSSLLSKKEKKKPSLMDLAVNQSSNSQKAAKNPPIENAEYFVDTTFSPDLINYQIQNKYDRYIQEELNKVTTEELKIQVRIRDAKFLIKEFTNLRDSLKDKEKINLDAYKKHVEKFKDVHFKDILDANKSIVTDDQNPFTDNLDLENVSKKDLDEIVDKLSELIDQEQNSISHLASKIKRFTEDHYRVSFITSQRASKKNEMDVMIANQNK